MMKKILLMCCVFYSVLFASEKGILEQKIEKIKVEIETFYTINGMPDKIDKLKKQKKILLNFIDKSTKGWEK